jgi:DNA modification methylase
LVDLAVAAGFVVQRWPLIWYKTYQCQNGAGAYNYTKNYEVALVCRKPNTTLTTSQSSSVWQGGYDVNEKETLGHPFAKPKKLWQWIYGAVAQRGQVVLDPFAGCGSSTLAAISNGLRPITVELTDHHYNRAVVNVTNLYKSMHPKVQFV